jgi:hypothetical protein
VTANRTRRRRSTWIALALSVAALIVTGVLGTYAVVSLADSRAGRDAASDTGRVAVAQRLPWTPTALIGVQADDGTLASTVVAVLPPEGRGGTLVPISASADAGSGANTVLRPLSAVFAAEGGEAWRAAAEQVTGLSFDVAEVIDQERFIQLVNPLGDLPALVPFAFTDGTTGTTYEGGGTVLSSAAAFRVLTATNADGPDWQLDPVRNAVWDAIADRVGAGIGSLPDGVRFERGFPPSGLDQFVDALFAAPLTSRELVTTPIDPERVAEELPAEYADTIGIGWQESVVSLRRGEVAMVFGSISPARVGAPLEGPTVRLVSGYTDEDVAPLGANRSDVLIGAIDVLLFTKSNVLSVVDDPGLGVPDRTTIHVADEALIDGVWELYGDAFGEMQVAASEVAIDGIDLEITLGRDYLRTLADPSEAAPTTSQASSAGSGAEPSEESGEGSSDSSSGVAGSDP